MHHTHNSENVVPTSPSNIDKKKTIQTQLMLYHPALFSLLLFSKLILSLRFVLTTSFHLKPSLQSGNNNNYRNSYYSNAQNAPKYSTHSQPSPFISRIRSPCFSTYLNAAPSDDADAEADANAKDTSIVVM